MMVLRYCVSVLCCFRFGRCFQHDLAPPFLASSSISTRQPGLMEKNQCHQSIVGADAALLLLTVLSRRRPTESLGVVAHRRFRPELVKNKQ
jgi:hypothetical protein